MDSLDPFDMVSQLQHWIENTFSCFEENISVSAEAKKRYQIVIEIIKRCEQLNMPIPDEVMFEKANIEEIFNASRVKKEQLSGIAKALSTLADSINHKLSSTRSPQKRTGTRRPNRALRITFPDGTVVEGSNAANTFINTIEYIGLERVSELRSIRSYGHPLVSSEQNEHARNAHKIRGYYIETHSSTKRKASYIRRIAEELNIDITIELIDR